MFGRIKKEEDENGVVLKIEHKKFNIFILRYSYIITLIADIILGCFFITGSILNLLGSDPFYSNMSYLIGSLAMTVRPIIRVYKHIQVKKKDDGEDNNRNIS
ncbi:YrhK family protein [Niallia sp. XMNu-256]|uniref:YrhK family protein n=1 Tax=Niallia sp. XMNu-256 TaxID=3082444 RepID=UPI0030CCAF89